MVQGIHEPMGLAHVLVAVPGARAGRTLLGYLAAASRERGWKGFFPPRVLTQGRLVDELLCTTQPSADRTTRTLAWERALQEADAETLARLVAQVPPRTDRSAWWRIAEDLRTVHAELAVEGYDFLRVRERMGSDLAGGSVPASELKRWESLASVQATWREELRALGAIDPHEGRFAALTEGSVQRDAEVMLVGIVEVSGLLRRALAELETTTEVLIFAPESEAGGFDEFGALRPEAWIGRSVPLPLERWRVVRTPEDQARLTVAIAASSESLEYAGDLSIGVADDEVVPYLVRRLEAAGVRARDAAGTPFSRTAPARLLAELRMFLETRSSASLAALVRHPDLERALRSRLDFDPVLRLDDYRPEHLPRRFDLQEPDVADAARRRRDVEPLLEALHGILGPLALNEPRSLARAADDLRESLRRIYTDHPLLLQEVEPEDAEDARVLRASLEGAASALVTLETTPPEVAGEASPAAAIGLLLRIGEAEALIAPAPVPTDQPSVELLGWLELLLDTAPHLVVTGFNEGRVPASAEGDSFLPDRVRGALGLEDDERRTARDIYITTALLASRGERVTFVSGRQTRDGDPIFPTRLAFLCDPAEAGERVDHALAPEVFAPVVRVDHDGEEEFPPYVLDRPAPDTLAVTAFKAYMESPVMFHIRRILRAESVDDRLGEMDPRSFGTFTHEILEEFARGPVKDSEDEATIYRFLEKTVVRLRQRFFPEEVLPAVPLQIEQLKLRLQSFAKWQAATAAEGWRIREVEWSPNAKSEGARRGCVELTMKGADSIWVKGKIDRIDQHADGRWRVLDYKTSHKSNEPESVHRKIRRKEGTTEWRDLQLPLYAHMTQELTGNLEKGGKVPELGYLNLPGNGGPVELKPVRWDAAVIADALETAREVAAKIRQGDFRDLGKPRGLEPIEEELLGIGLVVPPDSGADEDESFGSDGGAA
ncbi:ATP-dependent helicase/deoxyribonuclease subunit B [Planctomycetes bacterium Poly30]|uniref:ATP-dependent helicase/deoxyribonuclease subunit B n=2 Tax=Saltatorellus ferox TaxID=2528018 RepID=A0A518EXB9_9BACT|nr:ATP-dependent helicase/deoxyribonuclease subunit B [Planctomycetes bacterium Poly30]